MIPQFASCSLEQEQQNTLKEYYQSPIRYYHSLHHIQEMFGHFCDVHALSLWTCPKEVYMALLYHDAIYEYGAKDNEEQSALVAERDIQRFQSGDGLNSAYVARLIRLTADHGSLKAPDLSSDEKLFLDCDMAIVGSSTERYQEYERQIQQEYTQIYIPLLYRMGRKRFLKKVLRSDRIFFSDLFHEKYDQQARINIKSALKAL